MQRQLELRFRGHRRGGKRKNAGRKPNGPRAGVSHPSRPRFARTLPVHVTVRMAKHVYNLRSRRCFSAVGRALGAAAERFGMRIVQFSVQGNHMHLVVEAASNGALSQAMQGLSIRVAKGLNRVMHRKGRVFADRYHARPLRTPTEVRRALVYVRDNFAHHTGESVRDPYASPNGEVALPEPRTWLLTTGWRRAPPVRERG